MTTSRMASWAMILGVAGAAWFAVDQGVSARLRELERDRAVQKLSEARTLLTRHAELFTVGASPAAGEAPLKALLQDSGTKHGLLVGFLSESEREAGKGKREKQVSARLVRPPHEKLVRFLADLESRGSGAVVKELHLRPSKEASDTYEETEVVYARVFAAPAAGGKP
jgi:hypothetical protein